MIDRDKPVFDAPIPENAPSGEMERREALDPVVVRGMEIIQRSHYEKNPLVQIDATGFGGFSYLPSGERLLFPPSITQDKQENPYYFEEWADRGLTDAEIAAGISTLTGEADFGEGKLTRDALIIGLLDNETEHPHVIGYAEDGTAFDSQLSPEEKESILRLSFLSQLAGCRSDRYPDKVPIHATQDVVKEPASTSDSFDLPFLDSMFITSMDNTGERRLPGEFNQGIVAGYISFYQIVGSYREDRYDREEQSPLVERGEYFQRVVQSLGTMDDLDEQPTLDSSQLELPSRESADNID